MVVFEAAFATESKVMQTCIKNLNQKPVSKIFHPETKVINNIGSNKWMYLIIE